MEAPNIICSIAAPPKRGKTYLAMTFPEPIAFFSLDMGAGPIKAKFPEKDIDVFEFPMPLVDSLDKKTTDTFLPVWKELRDSIYNAIAWKKKEYKTIVIDPNSILWEIIRYAYNEEEERALGSGGKARNYGEPNARMSGIFQQAKLAGVNLVVTNYLKDKWVDDVDTGKQILDGWRRTEGAVDIVLEMRKETKATSKGEKKTIFYTTIKDNRYEPDLDGLELEMATYDDLLAVLLGV